MKPAQLPPNRLLDSTLLDGACAPSVVAQIGLVLHLGITVVAAGIYLFIARQAVFVPEHYLLCGLIFGVVVYLVMNFVVLPLSAVPFHLTYPPRAILQGFVSHALLVGIPIAACIRRFSFYRAELTQHLKVD